MSDKERGPVYGVELIELLPMNPCFPAGFKQAMPGRDELSRANNNGFARIAAGYEVLLAHWREQGKEIERLQREKAARIYYEDIVYSVCNSLELISRVSPVVQGCIACGTLETPETGVQDAMTRLAVDLQKSP